MEMKAESAESAERKITIRLQMTLRGGLGNGGCKVAFAEMSEESIQRSVANTQL